jgi:hypothetical protein
MTEKQWEIPKLMTEKQWEIPKLMRKPGFDRLGKNPQWALHF